MKEVILIEFGLTKNEAKVYSALLTQGPCLAGIISQKTGLHRRTVYDSIEMLIKKGLVGYILKNRRKIFKAANPKRFMEIIKEKEKKLEEIMPEMLLNYEQVKKKEETNFYRGKLGLKTVFEDQIETGEEILILGASPLAHEVLQFYFKWFDEKRKKRKIKTRIIFNQRAKKTPKIPLS